MSRARLLEIVAEVRALMDVDHPGRSDEDNARIDALLAEAEAIRLHDEEPAPPRAPRPCYCGRCAACRRVRVAVGPRSAARSRNALVEAVEREALPDAVPPRFSAWDQAPVATGCRWVARYPTLDEIDARQARRARRRMREITEERHTAAAYGRKA